MFNWDEWNMFRQNVIDRYSAAELCELLDLTTEELIDAFQEEVMKSTDLREDMRFE
jgi:hypothetical protein